MNVIFDSVLWTVFGERPSSTLTKINGFAKLPVGWDYGQGVPASARAVSDARSLYYELMQLGFTRIDAFPGTDGAIQLTVYEANFRYLIVIVKPSGEISLALKNNGNRDLPNIITTDINVIKTRIREMSVDKFREIVAEKWNIAGSYTHSNSIIFGGVTQRLHSPTMNLMDAYP
jgi:hypothetical protein